MHPNLLAVQLGRWQGVCLQVFMSFPIETIPRRIRGKDVQYNPRTIRHYFATTQKRSTCGGEARRWQSYHDIAVLFLAEVVCFRTTRFCISASGV